MIKRKEDLKNCIRIDKKYYNMESKREKIIQFITNDPKIKIWKYVKLLRKTEYYYNTKHSIMRNIKYTFYRNRKDTLGFKLGIELWENTFDAGLVIFHSSNIVVNGMSRIGKNCKLHGTNCIGNSGFSFEAPILGDNVDVGVGAKIIGDVYIADDIIIGAGAVVTKSFYEKGITIAGVPAKKIK